MKTYKLSDSELFFNLNPDMLCMADNEGNFIKVNKAWESVLGYTSEKLLKKNLLDFVHPEDFKKTQDAMAELQKQLQSQKFINRYRCENGSYVSLEWYLNSKDQTLYGVARNISEIIKEQEKLHESEENFFRFFHTIDDMIFIADTQGKIIFTNKAVGVKLNYCEQEALEMHILDFHPKEYHEQAGVIFNDMITGKTSSCQIPLANKDGVKVPVETRIWSGKWNNKECIYGISKDLSAQQSALDKFNKIFNSNPSLMALSSVRDGTFIDVNESFLKKLGYKRDEVLGKTSVSLDLFFQPEKQLEALGNLEKEKKISDIELNVKKKNGEMIKGLFSGEVIDNQFEKYFLTVMTDITNIKNTQDTLKKQTSLLKMILNISAEFLNATTQNLNLKIDHMLEASGRYFEVDRSYLFLFNEDNSSSSNSNEWCAKGIEPQKENLQNIPLKIMPWWVSKLSHHEYIYIPDINNMPLEAAMEREILKEQSIKSIVVIPVAYKEELIGFFGFDSVMENKLWDEEQISLLSILANILSDAITKCRMEEQIIKSKNIAESANRAKSQFLANMSHEIRTPVNGINGYLELLKDTELSDQQKDYFNKINISQKTLLALIEDILDLSRIESKKIILNEKPINIFSLTESMVNNYRNQFEQKRLDLKLDIDPNVPKTLLGDDERIKQILSNLLENSLKFTDVGLVKIEIKSKKISSKEFDLHFLVEDTGSGVSKDALKRIFEPFEREESKFTKSIKGYGLGIPICKSIIEAMGGKIIIESKNNKGTKIKFNIILKYDTKGIAQIKEIKREENINSLEHGFNKDLKILLAEDNEINSSLFLEILKTFGLKCDLAVNGLEAVSMCVKENYDIIFMDCQLPELDGISAAKKIRKIYDNSKKNYAIIAITAFAMDKDIEFCLKSGMDDCIIKPVNINRLKNLIKKYSMNFIKNSL